MAESKYVLEKNVTLPCSVIITKNKETGAEYLNYKLKVGKYEVELTTKEYNKLVNDIIKEHVRSVR